MMKKVIILLACAALGFTSCEKDDDVGPGKMDLTITLPDEYNAFDKSTIKVTLESVISADNAKTVNADKEGNVLFEEIVPGTYKISATATGKYSEVGISKTGDFKLIGAENNILIEGDQIKTINLKLSASDAGGLVISEFYYNFTWTEAGMPYMEDQYLHIYNNSDQVIYADGLFIGNASLTDKNETVFKDKDHVYLARAFKIPGNGQEHPIEPGEYIVLANDGMNHLDDENGNPGRSIDLSNADFEFWTHDNGAFKEDIDYANVPNLEQIFFNSKAWDWSPHNSHPIVVIFRSNEFDSYEIIEEYEGSSRKVVKLPVSTVIDGFEGIDDVESKQHLPEYVISKAFTGITEGWKGLICKRKVLKNIDGRDVLQNTRNNDEDFTTYEIYPGSNKTKSTKCSKALHPEEIKMLKEISNDF